ncbi:MAG: hypothetical protein IKF82_01105 [Bacilli bacterium]|nr:hypothetical protein [Bacilli bacterium]
MKLEDTKELMCSSDYKARFVAEYYQNKIRYEKLKTMCEKWDEGKLEFQPTCPREIYNAQLHFMKCYIEVLQNRAKMEDIELND